MLCISRHVICVFVKGSASEIGASKLRRVLPLKKKEYTSIYDNVTPETIRSHAVASLIYRTAQIMVVLAIQDTHKAVAD